MRSPCRTSQRGNLDLVPVSHWCSFRGVDAFDRAKCAHLRGEHRQVVEAAPLVSLVPRKITISTPCFSHSRTGNVRQGAACKVSVVLRPGSSS